MQMTVVPRKAAAVVLVRPSPTVDGPDGPAEVFLTRRPERMAFAGGNFVFPGGQLDPSDCAPPNLALPRRMEPERAAGFWGTGNRRTGAAASGWLLFGSCSRRWESCSARRKQVGCLSWKALRSRRGWRRAGEFKMRGPTSTTLLYLA